jgi:hypothetical protein
LVDNLKENAFSDPVADLRGLSGRIMIIRKLIEPGIQIKPFTEVEPEIKMMIFNKKLEEIKARRLSGLKQKFEIKSNIDYTKYLSTL